MENQKHTPIRNYSDVGAAKLREMTENSDVFADFLKFQGRVFKHNANVALEFFAQKPDAQFIATREQWERANRCISQSSKAIPFIDKNGGVIGFYDFSQIEGDNPPHRWMIHAKNAAEIKTALSIPSNGNLISGAVQNMLTPSEITASMAALRVPPQEFRKFSNSFVSTVQCIISGRLEVGGSRFNVVPDASMFRDLQTESEKLGFLNLAVNSARKILLKIESAALDLEAAERNEQNERENQLREIHGDDRGRVAADSERGSAGSSERAADEQNHSVESGTQGRSDGLSVNAGSDERKQHEMAADIRDEHGERREALVQTRSDQRTVQSESDRNGSIDGGRTDREVRDGLDELHGGALPGGNSGDAVSSSLSNGGTVSGEIGSGLSEDTGEGLREDAPKTDKRQLRGESEMESGDGFLHGQHGDERESLSSGDESLTAKLNSVFSEENNETSTNSADVFVLDEDMADLPDEEQLVQLALEIKQGEELVAELMRDRNYVEVSKIAQELDEMTRKADLLKEGIQKQTITDEDVQMLRSIQPPRKSVQNLLKHEVAQTTKFEKLLHDEMGEKSAYEMRKSDGAWLKDETKTTSVVDVPKRTVVPKKLHDIRRNNTIARGTFTNEDTKLEVIFSKRSIEEVIAKAIQDDKRNIPVEARIASLYQMQELIKNAVCFDCQVSEYNDATSKNKSPNTLFMHQLYGIVHYDGDGYLARLSVEESYTTDRSNRFNGTSSRIYNLKDMKITPIEANRIFDPAVGIMNDTEDTSTSAITISIPQLYALVKTYDKSFYENPDAPGREAREAELYVHAEYLDAVESAASGIEVTTETDKQVERIAEIRGIETEKAKAVAQKIVDTNINFSAGETENSSALDSSFSDKVHAAFAEIAEKRKYTAKQQKFMERLEKFVVKNHVTENMIDEIAKLRAFQNQYGSRKNLSYSLFGGRLGTLEKELEETIQRNLASISEKKIITLDDVIAKFFESDRTNVESENGTWSINLCDDDKYAEVYHNGNAECAIYLTNGKYTVERYSELSAIPAMVTRAMQNSLADTSIELVPFEPKNETVLDKAKRLINEFCESEYDSAADFSDLHNIGIAFTTLTDEELPIQVRADIIDFKITYKFDGEIFNVEQYDSLEDMIDNALSALDFSDLVSVPFDIQDRRTSIYSSAPGMIQENQPTSENTFEIYQLKQNDSTRDLRFENLQYLQQIGKTVDYDNYEKVYAGILTSETTLDSLYYQFNMEHPSDFTGHSLSISDVIVINRDGISTANYVDTIGFAEIPDFLPIQKQTEKVDTNINFSETDEQTMEKETAAVENEIVWTPISETEDENGRAGSYSTKYNGKFYWITENADGGYDIEADFGHSILNVGENYSNFPTRYLAEEAFMDYIEYMEQSFLHEKQALISVEIFGEEHYFKISDSSVDDILKTANTEKSLLKFMEMGENISGEEYAEIQQSDSFTYSVEMNLDNDTASVYMVNDGKGGISEADRTDSNVTFDTVKISDYSGIATDKLPETRFTSLTEESRRFYELYSTNIRNYSVPLKIPQSRERNKGTEKTLLCQFTSNDKCAILKKKRW